MTQEYRVEQREGGSKSVDRTVSVQVRPHDNEGLDESNNDDIDKGADSPEEEKEKVEDIRAPLEATEVKVNSKKKINIVPLDLKPRIYDKTWRTVFLSESSTHPIIMVIMVSLFLKL